jgi:hypothetical protein
VPVQFSGNFYKVSEDISEKGQIKKVEGWQEIYQKQKIST